MSTRWIQDATLGKASELVAKANADTTTPRPPGSMYVIGASKEGQFGTVGIYFDDPTEPGAFELQKCDVLLYVNTGADPFSTIARWAMGRFDHVSMYLGKAFGDVSFLFESDGRGAGIQSLHHQLGRRVQVMRPNLTELDWRLVIWEAIKLASSEQAYYDYFVIVRSCIPRILKEKLPFLPIPRDYCRDRMVICSEAVAEVFWRAGVDILPKDKVPLPGDFEKSPMLKTVYEGNLLKDIVPAARQEGGEL